MPCVTSTLFIVSFTVSPWLTVIVDGLNPHCFASTENSLVCGPSSTSGFGVGFGSQVVQPQLLAPELARVVFAVQEPAAHNRLAEGLLLIVLLVFAF